MVSQCAGGMHPTGMHSCLKDLSSIAFMSTTSVSPTSNEYVQWMPLLCHSIIKSLVLKGCFGISTEVGALEFFAVSTKVTDLAFLLML